MFPPDVTPLTAAILGDRQLHHPSTEQWKQAVFDTKWRENGQFFVLFSVVQTILLGKMISIIMY